MRDQAPIGEVPPRKAPNRRRDGESIVIDPHGASRAHASHPLQGTFDPRANPRHDFRGRSLAEFSPFSGRGTFTPEVPSVFQPFLLARLEGLQAGAHDILNGGEISRRHLRLRDPGDVLWQVSDVNVARHGRFLEMQDDFRQREGRGAAFAISP